MSLQFLRRQTVFLRPTLVVVMVTLFLAACGNKGNLVKPAPKDAPAPASAAPPATR
ncbi:MAG: lipoprotein [Dokdonella sp.]